MQSIQRVGDEAAARQLAEVLNSGARTRPVVVVTIPVGRDEPWIDADEVAREAGDLAEVYVLPTGALTWTFSDRIPEGTQVYGGAGRAYPVGHEWTSDPSRAPLHFAFNNDDGKRVTQELISDALRMAASAGLLEKLPTREVREAEGPVKLVVAGRALVEVGHDLLASIAEELTVADVPIERIVAPGQHVRGRYDAATKRLDVTRSLRRADEALSSYAVGDVVLTRVATVDGTSAELVLYPGTSTPAVTVTVARDDVTTNPADDLRTLMTVDEVVSARVAATGPHWALRLSDVDDDEPVLPAPALLAEGPPWLVEEVADEAEEPQALAPPAPPRPSVPVVEEPPEEAKAAPASPPEAAPTPAFRPSPTMLDRSRARRSPTDPSATPSPGPLVTPVSVPTPPPAPAAAPAALASQAATTKSLLLKIDALNAEVGGLERTLDALRAQVTAGHDERSQLSYLLKQAERRTNKAEADLKSARARLRKAGTKSAPGKGAPVSGPQFADSERGFRYLVETAWATRTLPSEQAERPLGHYILGPRFLESLDRLEGIKEAKVADVVFEVVTGLAAQLPSREVHRLRSGPGGDDPVRTRDDGAVAWRASLQVNTPSARRLHYWVRNDGLIEIARAAKHDDFDI